MDAPNERLAGLVAVLGDAETRELVRLFLSSAPKLVAEIATAEPAQARRAAHSLKSSAMQMGLTELSQQALGIEKRFDSGKGAPPPMDITLLQGRIRRAEAALRGYAGA